MNNLIEVRDLRLSYGRGRQRVSAVQGISFTVAKGECVGFIGANGAGKSTTIKAMMGFMYPDAGDARLFGFPSGDPKGRRHVGYLPEVALYYPFMKASELITLYGALSGTSHPTYGCVVRQDAFQLYVSRGFLRIRAVREAYPVLIEALHNPQQREQVRLAQLDFRTGAELGLRVRPRDRVAAPPGATDWGTYMEQDVFIACRMDIFLTGERDNHAAAQQRAERYAEHFPDLPTP